MRMARTLEYRDARKALDAGMVEAEARGLAMAFAVADHAGQPICAVRMDGTPGRVLRHALRKAFTAAEMGRDTLSFARDLADRGGDLAQWGNPDLTTLPGGLVAMADGQVLGSVACGGGPMVDDEAVARAMLRAMGLEPAGEPRS